MVTHPISNRAWCRVALLIEANTLPLSQAATCATYNSLCAYNIFTAGCILVLLIVAFCQLANNEYVVLCVSLGPDSQTILGQT